MKFCVLYGDLFFFSQEIDILALGLVSLYVQTLFPSNLIFSDTLALLNIIFLWKVTTDCNVPNSHVNLFPFSFVFLLSLPGILHIYLFVCLDSKFHGEKILVYFSPWCIPQA